MDAVDLMSDMLLDPFMPGDNLDEDGNPREFTFEPETLAAKATDFTSSRLEEVSSRLGLNPTIHYPRPDLPSRPNTHPPHSPVRRS